VINQFSVEDKTYIARAREVFIRMSLLAIMSVSCVLLLRPFLNLLISAVVIAVAIYPGYRVMTRLVRGHSNVAAVLCTFLLLLLIILPAVLLTGSLADGVSNIVNQLHAGQLKVPPPPASLYKVPVVGGKLTDVWNMCSTNLSESVSRFAPQIRKSIPGLISASAGIGGALLQFLISIVLAGVLLAYSKGGARFADRVFARVFDDQGPEFEELVSNTIRSVTNGIVGVAVIQSACASLGFWLVGLPGAGLWAALFFVASVLQIGQLVLVVAVLYAFAAYSTTHAVMFLAWCIVGALMDNVLKPILLGRGSKVPMGVIFLGVIGGFIAMRLLGLFVGAIVLSVGYKLFIAWLDAKMPSALGSDESASKATVATS
jgi:predicted PurR-regulated permease PerM